MFRKFFSFFWEIFGVVVISLAIVIPIRYFLAQPFFVRGASMEPNFKDGQYLIIDEITYRLSEPNRGDVVVFKYPLDISQYYIKRIIGLPGEKVIVKNGELIIYNNLFPQGWKMEESYLPKDRMTYGDTEIQLGNQEYFALGDNRMASFDSRRWGVLPRKDIIGKVYLRAWPFAAAQIIPTPLY